MVKGEKEILSPWGMHCISCTSGSNPLGQVRWHWPWRKYRPGLHLAHISLLTHTSQPIEHSETERHLTLYCSSTEELISVTRACCTHSQNNSAARCLTCAFSQCRVCHQPVRTALFTFALEQEVTRMTMCAEMFTETGSAVLLAPCRPMEMNFGQRRATTQSGHQDIFSQH